MDGIKQGVFSVLALLSMQISAAELSLPNIEVNGFATLAAVMTNSDDVTYLGAGEEVSFESDSKAGLQFTVPVHERFTYTMQVISKAQNDYQLETEWAFAAFKVTDTVKIRAGRLRIPFFLKSETLEVGYSYPWARVPLDTYGQFAFSRFSGVDALISIPLENSEIVIHPHFGTSASGFEMMGMAGDFSVENLIGVNLTWSLDWINFRLGHTEGDYDVYGFDALAPLAGIMYSFSGDQNAADQFAITERHGQFTGLGIDAEYANAIFIAEYNKRKTDGLMTDTDSWYVTVGYRFGKVMPHLTFSEYKTKEDYSVALATIPNINTGDAAIDTQLQGAYTQIINFNTANQQSITAGLRYDFMPKAALKLEWQHVVPDEASSLLSPPFEGEGAIYMGQDLDDVDLFTLAIDVIF